MTKSTINTTIFSHFRLPKRSGGQVGGDAAGRGGLKKQLLLSTIAFLLITYSPAQNYGWVDLSANIPGETQNLSDIHFISSDTCWITSSSSPEIFYSTDGAQSFISQDNEYNTNLQSIFMVSSNEGYIGGESGIIYRTTNSGADWNYHSSTTGGITVNDITFPPDLSTPGYCCGWSGIIYEIYSGGIYQMSSYTGSNLISITFPSAEGWVCGEHAIRHYTAGSWTSDQSAPFGIYNSIYFIPGTTQGWCVGDKLFSTTNGTSWVSHGNPDVEERLMMHVFFLNESEGWIVGAQGLIMQTTDGGTVWTTHESNTEDTLWKIFAIEDDIYIIGDGGFFKKYGVLTGKEEMWVSEFNIYPNPVVDEFKVQSPKFFGGMPSAKVGGATIELYDLNSRKLIEKHIPAGTETVEIDVSGLESGVYFCKISTEKYSVTKKLIIQKK
jgi:photosystem II stability/assembly factor-like uncharacterized protein